MPTDAPNAPRDPTPWPSYHVIFRETRAELKRLGLSENASDLLLVFCFGWIVHLAIGWLIRSETGVPMGLDQVLVLLLSALIGGLIAPEVYLIGFRTYQSRPISQLAAVLSGLYFATANPPGATRLGSLPQVLIFGGMFMVLNLWIDSRVGYGIAAGIAWGLAVVIRPDLIWILAVVAALIGVMIYRDHPDRLRCVLALAGVLAVMLWPMAWRFPSDAAHSPPAFALQESTRPTHGNPEAAVAGEGFGAPARNLRTLGSFLLSVFAVLAARGVWIHRHRRMDRRSMALFFMILAYAGLTLLTFGGQARAELLAAPIVFLAGGSAIVRAWERFDVGPDGLRPMLKSSISRPTPPSARQD